MKTVRNSVRGHRDMFIKKIRDIHLENNITSIMYKYVFNVRKRYIM